MPKRLYLELNSAERAELTAVRDTHAKPYMREKASALLQIANGASAHHVARFGLLKPRDPETVCSWLKRYQANGVDALYVQPGRGRPAAFSPSA